MGYKQVGIAKNGKKKYKITIELGKDILGKRRRITRDFTGTLAEVKIRDAELTKQYYHKGNNANVKALTFQQYSEVFIKKHCEGNIGLVTIKNYKRLLRDIMPYLGSYKLDKITPAKGVGRATGARVQNPPAPPSENETQTLAFFFFFFGTIRV